MTSYVFDTGALVAVERRKQRALRFWQLASLGRARIYVPLAVIAEWWRGRTRDRERILAATEVVVSVAVAKAAGVALAAMTHVDASATVDAMVIATGALLDAVVVTQDVEDFDSLSTEFPGVTILAI